MELPSRAGDGVEPSVVETVEVVSAGGGGDKVLSPGGTETTLKIIAPTQISVPLSTGIIEIDPQSLGLVTSNFDVSAVTPLSLSTTHPTLTGSSILSDVHLGAKRPLSDDALMEGVSSEVPRKKSRNYLDSHKTIEKRRRDRINNGLSTLKDMVPNCRQYGSKKLDKAEVLEMTIEYIHRLHQNQSNGCSNADLAASQRDWANEIMSWVFHNKLLYSGPNAIEQFSNALLLHLQSFASVESPQATTSSVTATTTSTNELIYNQYTPGDDGSMGEEDDLHHHTHPSSLLIQSSTETVGKQKEKEDIAPVVNTASQQQQLAQLQALLLLQQQQQVFQDQEQQESASNTEGQIDANAHQQIQQLQQLHQLQTLLLQHLTNDSPQKQELDGNREQITSTTAAQSIMVSDVIDSTGSGPSTGLGLSSSIDTGLASPNVYHGEETLETGSSQMWSQTEHSHHDSPLLIDSVTGDVVQEEVELLEQEH